MQLDRSYGIVERLGYSALLPTYYIHQIAKTTHHTCNSHVDSVLVLNLVLENSRIMLWELVNLADHVTLLISPDEEL
jgi:hypothetical protein